MERKYREKKEKKNIEKTTMATFKFNKENQQ